VSGAAIESWAVEARGAVASARSVVVKVGTQALTGGSDELDRGFMDDLARRLADEMARGRRVLLVSSGAIGAGLGALGLARRPTDVASLQAAASAGQPLLMSLWREAFGLRGVAVGQILLGRGDFDNRRRFLNMRNCVNRLHDFGAIPIINENDSVATEEISLGDNDVLAAKVAVAVRAEALVILTNTAGVLDGAGVVICEAQDAGSLARYDRSGVSPQGRGGIGTKIEAARIAGEGGLPAVIASARPAEVINAILRGERVGTCVFASANRRRALRQWVALGATPAGTIEIDEGAARALADRNASLLARGVTGVTGRFEVGDVVLVSGPGGAEVARGLTNLTSDEVRAVMGKSSVEMGVILGRRVYEEVVHRDNMAVTKGRDAGAGRVSGG